MRPTLPLLVLLAACDGGSLVVGGNPPPGGEDDTDVLVETDTQGGGGGGGGGGANDTDTVVDTDTTPTNPDPFGADPLLWSGHRDFTYTYTVSGGQTCTLAVDEVGEQVYGAGFLQIERACADCQRVFKIDLQTDGFCPPSQFADTTYRGLKFLPGGQVELYVIAQDRTTWTSSLLATGTVQGDTLSYTYRDKATGYRWDVVGSVTLR